MYGPNSRPQDLNISGKRAVSFWAEELAYVSNRETSEETKRRWDDVRAYKVDPEWAEEQYQKARARFGNRARKLEPFRLGIARCTTWDGERDSYRVFYLNTIEQMLDVLRSQVPHLYREVEEELRLSTAPPRKLEHETRRSAVES